MGDLGQLLVAKGLKSCPKSNKSPNLVTVCVCVMYMCYVYEMFVCMGACVVYIFLRLGWLALFLLSTAMSGKFALHRLSLFLAVYRAFSAALSLYDGCLYHKKVWLFLTCECINHAKIWMRDLRAT